MNRSRPIFSRAAASAGPGWLTPIHVLVEVLGGRALAARARRRSGSRRWHPSCGCGPGPCRAGRAAGDPGAPALGDHEPQPGEPLEDAGQDELNQRTLRVERHLVDVEQHRHRVGPVVGHAGAAVDVDRHLELLEHRPHRVVDRVVQRLHPVHVGRDVRQQDAAAQVVLLDPADVGDGVVDVVEEDLPDAGPPLRELAAPVDQPAVVGPDAGEAVLVVLRPRRLGEQHEAGEERRHRVREDDLTDDAVGRLLAVAHLVVPVAVAPRSPRSRKGVLVLPRQASKSSRNRGSRYSRYCLWLPPAWQSAEMIV